MSQYHSPEQSLFALHTTGLRTTSNSIPLILFLLTAGSFCFSHKPGLHAASSSVCPSAVRLQVCQVQDESIETHTWAAHGFQQHTLSTESFCNHVEGNMSPSIKYRTRDQRHSESESRRRPWRSLSLAVCCCGRRELDQKPQSRAGQDCGDTTGKNFARSLIDLCSCSTTTEMWTRRPPPITCRTRLSRRRRKRRTRSLTSRRESR